MVIDNIMKKTIICLVLFSLCLSLCGCGEVTSNTNLATPSTNEKTNTSGAIASGSNTAITQEEADSDVKSKIELTAIPTSDGTVCVFVKNNSNTIVDYLDIQVLYKDSNGQIIDTDSDGHDMILPGYTVVSRMDAPDNYATVESAITKFELGNYPKYKNHSDNVSISANSADNKVIVSVTNNDSEEIEEIEICVVFYKGSDIAGCSYCTDIYDVAPNETKIEEFSAKNYDYDRFEVFLNQAHTFS